MTRSRDAKTQDIEMEKPGVRALMIGLPETLDPDPNYVEVAQVV